MAKRRARRASWGVEGGFQHGGQELDLPVSGAAFAEGRRDVAVGRRAPAQAAQQVGLQQVLHRDAALLARRAARAARAAARRAAAAGSRSAQRAPAAGRRLGGGGARQLGGVERRGLG